jgi:hypothetical protein
MMAADYRHIGGVENRLGRHYSRFSPFSPTPALADQSLARRKLWNAGSNRRSRANDVSEQTATAEVLSDMDAEIAALEQRRAKTQALKQAMMQELLTGKTRVVTPEAVHA